MIIPVLVLAVFTSVFITVSMPVVVLAIFTLTVSMPVAVLAIFTMALIVAGRIMFVVVAY